MYCIFISLTFYNLYLVFLLWIVLFPDFSATGTPPSQNTVCNTCTLYIACISLYCVVYHYVRINVVHLDPESDIHVHQLNYDLTRTTVFYFFG